MSLNDFNLFLATIGNIISRYWSLLSNIKIAGVSFTNWLLSFVVLSFLFLAFRGIIGSPVGFSSVWGFVSKDRSDKTRARED